MSYGGTYGGGSDETKLPIEVALGAPPVYPPNLENRTMIPSLDFRVGCECEACQIATLLWYGDERTHPRMAWEHFWEKRAGAEEGVWVCEWQLGRLLNQHRGGNRGSWKILGLKVTPRSVSDR